MSEVLTLLAYSKAELAGLTIDRVVSSIRTTNIGIISKTYITQAEITIQDGVMPEE